MTISRSHRPLILVFTLVPLTMACEIKTRLGTSPVDAGSSPDVSRPTDSGSGMDRASQEISVVEGGVPADSGGVRDSSVSTDGGTDQSVVFACLPGGAPQVSAVPIRRLTNFEYNNTVRDMLGDSSRPADVLPFDGFQFDPNEFFVDVARIDGYHTLAHDHAVKVTKDAASVIALIQCDPAAQGETVCQQRFIETFVPRIFRRALEPADSTDFAAIFAKGRELGGSFASGVRAVVEVALQSPEFLFRIEFGQPVGAAQPALARPTAYEMATRLSYLLWGSAPDAALRDAAAQDKLQTKEQIAVQARRMLTDPRARDVVRAFYFQLLRLKEAGFLSSLIGAPQLPKLSADIPGLLLKETSAFIDEVTWQGPGDFQTLLTAPFSFMNASLARFYGVNGATDDTFRKVNLDVNQRAGILTQASVLASTSHPTSNSPVFRGKLLFEQILCGRLDPPPPVVPASPPPDPVAPTTTRERYRRFLFDPSCVPCHNDMDPVGFGFEHFDAIGLWRDMENGQPIDATGEIFKTDAKGKFNGAIELIQRLAQSRDAQNCYVGKWMTFGYGHNATAEDACSVQTLQDAFAQSKGNVRELLVALTQTDAFLYRTAK